MSKKWLCSGFHLTMVLTFAASCGLAQDSCDPAAKAPLDDLLHAPCFGDAKISPDLKRVAAVASLSPRKPILVRELATGQELHLASKGGSNWLGSVVFAPSNTVIFTSHYNDTVAAFDLRKNGEEVIELEGHPGGRSVLAIADNTVLASYGFADGKVLLYDLHLGANPIKSLAVNMDDSEMAFSPDSKLLAIGGGEACEDCGVDDKHPAKPRPEDLDPDNSVKIFDVSTGKKIKVLAGHVKSVDAIAFAPNGQILATGDNNGSIRLWNVSTWNELRKFGNRDDQLEVVVFSPDNRLLAAGTFDGLIRLWDVTTGRQLRMLSGHTYSILDLAFTPDGKQLLSVDSSAKLLVKRWDVDSGQEIPLQPAAAQ